MPKPDWGNGASGAISGGAQGFAMGGPVGGVVGSIAGGLGGLFGGKKKRKLKKLSTLDERQQQLYGDYNDAFYGQGPFANQYQYDANQANQVFDQNIAAPAYENYRENIIPEVTGQFRKNNIQNSSYTGEALSRHGRDIQRNLDAKRAAMQFEGQQNALDRRQRGINDVLNMQTFAYERPEQGNPSAIDQILGSIGPKAGEWFADYLSNKGAGSSGTGSLAGASGSSSFSPFKVG